MSRNLVNARIDQVVREGGLAACVRWCKRKNAVEGRKNSRQMQCNEVLQQWTTADRKSISGFCLSCQPVCSACGWHVAGRVGPSPRLASSSLLTATRSCVPIKRALISMQTRSSPAHYHVFAYRVFPLHYAALSTTLYPASAACHSLRRCENSEVPQRSLPSSGSTTHGAFSRRKMCLVIFGCDSLLMLAKSTVAMVSPMCSGTEG